MIAISDKMVGTVWAVGLLYWIVLAFGAKRTKATAPAPQQTMHHALGLGAGILFCFHFRHTLLAWTLLPRTETTAVIGMAILIVGMSFTFWARAMLGRNWSARVTIKEDHRLIRRGPYALVRHPIYTGLLTSVLGSAIVFGRLHHFLAFGLITVAYWHKSRVEERMLTREFGAEYEQYRREVRALVPYVF